jgi:hypothetical protein
MLFKEMIVVYNENYTKDKYKIQGHIVKTDGAYSYHSVLKS